MNIGKGKKSDIVDAVAHPRLGITNRIHRNHPGPKYYSPKYSSFGDY